MRWTIPDFLVGFWCGISLTISVVLALRATRKA
jgi:hypothetical protein